MRIEKLERSRHKRDRILAFLEDGTLLRLTEQGQAYASDVLGTVYEAERQALCETLQAYSPEFVEALDYFSQRLHEAYLRRFRPAHERERTRPPEE